MDDEAMNMAAAAKSDDTRARAVGSSVVSASAPLGLCSTP